MPPEVPADDQLADYPQGAPEGNSGDSPAQQQTDFLAEEEASADNTAATNPPA